MTISNMSKQNKQVVLLYFCTIWGVITGVLASIINTHFIDPKDYGDVRYVQNIINLISSFVLFGYFLSGSRILALSEDKIYRGRVKGVMIIILIIAVGIIMLSCLICSYLPTSKDAIPSLFLIAIPFCGNQIYQNYINTTAQGDNQIGRIAFLRLAPSLIYLPLAYFVYSTWGATSTRMIIIQLGISTLFGLGVIISTNPIFKDLTPIWEELKKENKNYGMQLYIGSLVMVATNYLAGISISVFNEDNTQVGYYTLALTVTSPLQMLPSIIGTTYFRKFATLPKIPNKVIKFTVLIAFVSCSLFILLIHPMVKFLYSDRYAIVGTYASWLSVGFTIHGIGDMINRYLGSHGKGKEIRNASIYNGVFKLLGYSVFVWLFNTPGALVTTVLCSLIYSFTIFYYYCKLVKVNQCNEEEGIQS